MGQTMTWISDVRLLLKGCEANIYKRKPTKSEGQPTALTLKQRRQVDRLSTERGYRRFTADRMSSI